MVLLKNASEWLDKSIWEEGNGNEMLQFKKAIRTFTDAIFSDINYANRLISCAYNSDEIVSLFVAFVMTEAYGEIMITAIVGQPVVSCTTGWI